MPSAEFFRGPWGTINLATQQDGTSLAERFIAGLETSERLKLLALLKRAADVGPRNINDGEKFKKLEGTLFEFKSYQTRMPCFYDGRTIVLTHGYKKKQNRTPPAEISRAKAIQKHYESSKIATPSKRVKS